MDRLPITAKFIEGYFTPSSLPNYRLSQVQLYMAMLAHNSMKIVLKAFPQNKFFRDMGLLLTQDIINYEMLGRIIPEDSDLLFGLPQEILLDKKLKAQFGGHYSMSVGGIAFTTSGEAAPIDVFKYLARTAYKAQLFAGDLTYLEGGALREPVIVLSNSRYSFYNNQFVNRFIPHKAVESYNGGITYQRHIIKF